MESVISRIVPEIWLMLSPFAVFFVFVVALVLFVAFKWSSPSEKWLLRIVGAILIISGSFTVFNLFDFWHFRKYGGQAFSPINREWFFICFPPKDLNVPYCRMPLNEKQSEYKIQFNHKYLGDHTVALNVVNNAPKPFDYDNPDRIGLKFFAVVNMINKPCQALVSGGKSYGGYFLHRGTNELEIIQYDFQTAELLDADHEMTVKVEGDLHEFLQSYPGSYISIRNSMHK
ncbi:MAG: hypothetical protein MJZ55_04700 [Paludibacteraceae bacterium]|nr:hypothetical protein [Paludibacteraceae bacterium]